MCVGALFGVLRAGVVVVMVNPELPHRPGSALATELQEFVRAHLEYFKCPREIAFLEDLPRTHLNKVDRNGLARWMATGLKTGGPTK
jgi:acyl-coenzyme A synthetase/AMP-(fatty) acid ligase